MKTLFHWSGGKDSALALHHLRQDQNAPPIRQIITSVNSRFQRISMHGVRESLLDAQAKALGLPLYKLLLPEQPSMEQYNQLFGQSLQHFKEQGYTHTAFGDIFLEDLRTYREQQLAPYGFQVQFPLWKRNTKELLHEFLDLGFKTILVCIKAECLNKDFAGRIIDHDFLKDLPNTVDPCGENGEFHTFVFDGPIFNTPIPITIGETIYRAYPAPNAKGKEMGFWFTDLSLNNCVRDMKLAATL